MSFNNIQPYQENPPYKKEINPKNFRFGRLPWYWIKRVFLIPFTMLLLFIISFSLMLFLPGSPGERKLQNWQLQQMGKAFPNTDRENKTSSVVEKINSQYNFSISKTNHFIQQLTQWVKFDFGESLYFHEPVWDVIKRKLPITFLIGIISLCMSYAIGILFGLLKAIQRNRLYDQLSDFLLLSLSCTPPLVIALLVFMTFSLSSLKINMLLAIICYVIIALPEIIFLSRDSFQRALHEGYVLTARSKGLTLFKIYTRHIMKNIFVPLVNRISSSLKFYFSGSILIESIFQLDGLGLATYLSIKNQDYNLLFGLIFYTGCFFLFFRILLDFVLTLMDPRLDFQ